MALPGQSADMGWSRQCRPQSCKCFISRRSHYEHMAEVAWQLLICQPPPSHTRLFCKYLSHLKLNMRVMSSSHYIGFNYPGRIPYAPCYKPRLVYFVPHFSLGLVIKALWAYGGGGMAITYLSTATKSHWVILQMFVSPERKYESYVQFTLYWFQLVRT